MLKRHMNGLHLADAAELELQQLVQRPISNQRFPVVIRGELGVVAAVPVDFEAAGARGRELHSAGEVRCLLQLQIHPNAGRRGVEGHVANELLINGLQRLKNSQDKISQR